MTEKLQYGFGLFDLPEPPRLRHQLQRRFRLLCDRFFAKQAKDVLFAPTDLGTCDPTAGQDILSGRFVLAGQAVELNQRDLFHVMPPSPSWTMVLHSFVWLRHLRAVSPLQGRQTAQMHVMAWIANRCDHPEVAYEPTVMARRTLAWLAHSPLVLEGISPDHYDLFCSHLAYDMRVLQRFVSSSPQSSPAVLAAIAALSVCLCLKGLEKDIEPALEAFQRVMTHHFDPDGGPVSRNPWMVLDAAAHLWPLRQTLVRAGYPVPSWFDALLSSMHIFLQAVRLSDGSLFALHGMGATPIDLLASVMACDSQELPSSASLVRQGFLRLEAGRTTLLVDVGSSPVSSDLWQGPALSFALSCGPQPIVVAPGTRYRGLLFPDPDPQAVVSSVWPASAADVAVRTSVVRNLCQGEREDRGTLVSASSTNTTTLGAFEHSRSWLLSRDGRRLNVDDVLSEAGPMVIRLLLHPSVEPKVDKKGVLLTASDGSEWRLKAPDAAISFEPSFYAGVPDGRRSTVCIRLEVQVEAGVPYSWSMARMT